MPRLLFLAGFLFAFLSASSQTNVRAWYADGQVWIVWKMQLPLTETVEVYASPQSFNTTSEANLIGRPFILDYLPTAMKEQIDTAATYRIPDGFGGNYQLERNEGLFVYTPHEGGELYFAVVSHGETEIIANENITDTAVTFQYDPVNDPVECHRQLTFISPFNSQYLCFAYYMWADGRHDHLDRREDIPVMANFAKNGMPGFFLVSFHNNINVNEPFPLSVWLHGGGGTAIQSIAGSRPVVDIRPLKGILVAHSDDVFGHRGEVPPFIENPSLHFGYRENWNPFTEDNYPTERDTIINYTQRRYIWIDEWLMKNFNVDPHRVHIHGHSMGSWGATGLAKAYPEHFASAVLFNNGFRGVEEGGSIIAMFGDVIDHFPTNLQGRTGATVTYPEIFDLITSASAQRDLPVIKSFHSKNDVGNANHWGPEVVINYQAADASGHGMALSWSERAHGIDTGPDYDDHWVNGNDETQQTATDNVSWGEDHYRSDIAYPAFFNHRLDPNANDPGDGTIGTGAAGVGDDWGTWGGWHRWDNETIEDHENLWSVEAWLESNAVFENDNSPHELLTADLAIRRPVNFKPGSGDMISWEARDVNSDELLQSGDEIVADDDLVILRGVEIFREPSRRVRIIIRSTPLSSNDLNDIKHMSVIPNPFNEEMKVRFSSIGAGSCRLRIYSIEGRMMMEEKFFHEEGENELKVNSSVFPEGIYFLEINSSQGLLRQLVVK